MPGVRVRAAVRGCAVSTLDLTPGSDAWRRLVTASKVAAILGASPWESPRSLWLRMHGDVPWGETNAVQERGTYVEAAILAWWRDQHCEFEVLREQPTYKLGDWAAATPDMVAYLTDPPPVEGQYVDGLERQTLVEAKSVAYDDEWGEPGTDQIPAYYYAQALWQLHMSGVSRCYVPILGPRLRFAEYVVEYDPEMGADLERRCRAFYDSLAADTPPPLDDTVATYEAVRRVHPDIDRGESVELDAEVAYALVAGNATAKIAERHLRGAKSAVLDRMGTAQYATCDGVRVARRQPRGDEVTFVVVGKPSDLTDQESAA